MTDKKCVTSVLRGITAMEDKDSKSCKVTIDISIESLKCGVCLEYPECKNNKSPNVWTCMNRHHVCATCRQNNYVINASEVCPTCKTEILYPDIISSAILQKIKISCPNAGCDATFFIQDQDNHDCKFRPMECPHCFRQLSRTSVSKHLSDNCLQIYTEVSIPVLLQYLQLSNRGRFSVAFGHGAISVVIGEHLSITITSIGVHTALCLYAFQSNAGVQSQHNFTFAPTVNKASKHIHIPVDCLKGHRIWLFPRPTGVGERVVAKDSLGVWYCGEIVRDRQNKVTISFKDWHTKHDEEINLNFSPTRILPLTSEIQKIPRNELSSMMEALVKSYST